MPWILPGIEIACDTSSAEVCIVLGALGRGERAVTVHLGHLVEHADGVTDASIEYSTFPVPRGGAASVGDSYVLTRLACGYFTVKVVPEIVASDVESCSVGTLSVEHSGVACDEADRGALAGTLAMESTSDSSDEAVGHTDDGHCWTKSKTELGRDAELAWVA